MQQSLNINFLPLNFQVTFLIIRKKTFPKGQRMVKKTIMLLKRKLKIRKYKKITCNVKKSFPHFLS